MADKAGATPVLRISALFQILQDWVELPGMREQCRDALRDDDGQAMLKAYLLQLVQAAGVAFPDMVASQVHMLLLGALNEALRQPASPALQHGADAALLLVNPRRPGHRTAGLATAASVALLAGLLLLLAVRQQPEFSAARPGLVAAAITAVPSPDKLAALYHLHDQIRSASCSYPQALMLAPEQRAPFLESVVDGQVGDIGPEAMVMVSQLYQKVDCYYPPAAMLL